MVLCDWFLSLSIMFLLWAPPFSSVNAFFISSLLINKKETLKSLNVIVNLFTFPCNSSSFFALIHLEILLLHAYTFRITCF